MQNSENPNGNAKSHKLIPSQVDIEQLEGKPNEFDGPTVKRQYTNQNSRDRKDLLDLNNDDESLDIMPDNSFIEPLPSDLSAKQVQIITRTWSDLLTKHNSLKIGIICLKQLIPIDRSTFEVFMKCDLSEKADETKYLQSAEFSQKATEAFEQINQTIQNVCADPTSPELRKSLKVFGSQLRNAYNVSPDNFYNAQQAFLNMLAMGLRQDFDNEARDAWTKLCKFVCEALISSNYDEDNHKSMIQSKIDGIQDGPLNESADQSCNLDESVAPLVEDQDFFLKNKAQTTVLQRNETIAQFVQNQHEKDEGLKHKSFNVSRHLQGNDILEPGLNGIELNIEVGGNQDSGAVKEFFKEKFQKEVDIHHRIAYLFEEVYRLNKQNNNAGDDLIDPRELSQSVDTKQFATELQDAETDKIPIQRRARIINNQIVSCISTYAAYIVEDPLVLFYCLFFCIFYKNEQIVEFIRPIIQKMNPPQEKGGDRIDKLLEYIDTYGIDTLRSINEKVNTQAYHLVMFQAIDDDFKSVYNNIIRQLKNVNFRDSDALHFLKTRDYALIEMSFKKRLTNIIVSDAHRKLGVQISKSYRKYNQAYFEEIIIRYDKELEARMIQNYRERFLQTHDDVYIVFEMYCKGDYDDQFMRTNKSDITIKQFLDLFHICIKNDSYRVGMLIYTMYMNPAFDMDTPMMDIVIQQFKASPEFLEMKLFLVHQHFDVMSIPQMNNLIVFCTEMCKVKDPVKNALICQYNNLKVAFLIYRICWKIEQKQIYSLITKCKVLQDYLNAAIIHYLEKQTNVLTLYKFLTEPILHLTKKQDVFDIILEMDMTELLMHPIIVEVLNFIYEGKFSASSNALSLSQTYQASVEVDAFSSKSLTDRYISNIVNFGDSGSPKQTSLQYNIWKQSIVQRESDEVVFLCLINMIIFAVVFLFNVTNTANKQVFFQYFTQPLSQNPGQLTSASPKILQQFCPDYVKCLVDTLPVVNALGFIVLLNAIGTVATVIQKLSVLKLKSNATIDYLVYITEIASVFCGFMLYKSIKIPDAQINKLVETSCKTYTKIDQASWVKANTVFSLENPLSTNTDSISFSNLVIFVVAQAVIMVVIMMQRTQIMGEIITMLNAMITELQRFFTTFFLVILAFMLAGRLLGDEFQPTYFPEEQGYVNIIQIFFTAFIGHPEIEDFVPFGKFYITCFMFVFKVLLLSLLASMFINRYKHVFNNLEAIRLVKIVNLKNTIQYDKYVGGITQSFFPINILMIPFLIPLAYMRSPRMSDFILKIQYFFMMILYIVLAMIFLVPSIPLFYLKSVMNSMFIAATRKKVDYAGQSVVQVLQAVILGPIIIIASMGTDLASLPSALLKDSKEFERKYSMSTDRLNQDQVVIVMKLFDKLFNKEFSRFQGQAMNMIELMTMHRKIFMISDNLHDLMCRGTKDYRQSLSTVQDYNLTKLLGHKCSIPDPSGDYKLSKVQFNVIRSVQQDVELYNYVDTILRKMVLGTLRFDMAAYERAINGAPVEGIPTEEEQIQLDLAMAAQGEAEDDDELRKVDGIMPIRVGPDLLPLKRNSSDLMNNLFINISALAFTNIEEVLAHVPSALEQRRNERFQNEIEDRKLLWKKTIMSTFSQQGLKYTQIAKRDLGIIGGGNNYSQSGSGNSKKVEEKEAKTSQKE